MIVPTRLPTCVPSLILYFDYYCCGSNFWKIINKPKSDRCGFGLLVIDVGGDSNGGYMTMLLVRDNPGYFAAAFPTCEGLKDSLISKKDLESIAKTPIWFTAAKTDTVLPPKDYAVPTVERLQKAGADVHFSFFDKVVDTSGKYKKADGTPYEYMGHWSWIYVYNDECEDTIDGKTVKLFQWLAEQKRK